jgi:peptidoglycan/LPS O-acetylase OafA/YrhL
VGSQTGTTTTAVKSGEVERPRTGNRPGAHRRDIEGLRALSIIMVMVWHAGVPWIPGGFVSLDVFFVISGFLITQLLVTELQSKGRLRLRRFYGRRAKRLLPAPTVVLLVVALLTPFLLPRTRWTETAHDIIATALYTMNWRLAAESTDYFQQDAAGSVLEHFWSLSAEEQFYILWPWLLATTAAMSFRRGRRSMGPALLAAFALIGVPSFAWSIYYSAVNPSAAYFVTTTRAWEFAVGGAFAMLTFTRFRLPRPVAIVVGWAGLATIFVAAVLITTEFAYPSYWAMIPCLATVAIIVAGFSAGRAGPVAVLGLAPMQMIGRMSYSLYLCHWPVIALTAAALGRVLTLAEGLIAVAASVPLAYLLYRFVENPVRYSKKLFKTSPRMLRAAAVTTVVTVTAGMALQLANWPPTPPFVPPAISTLATERGGDTGPAVDVDPTTGVDMAANPGAVVGAAALGDPPFGDPDGVPADTSPSIVPGPLVAHDDYTDCTQSLQSAEIRTCTYGKRDAEKTIAVVGDSHANQWVPGIVEVAAAHGWRVVEYTKAACSFTDVLISTKEGQPYVSCQEWSRAVLDRLLNAEKPTMVVTSGLKKRVFIDGEIAFQQEGLAALADGLHRNYRALNDAGIPVVVIKDSPTPEIDIADCVAANQESLTQCAGDRSKMLPADHSAEQSEALADLPQSRMIDLNDAICPADRCPAVVGNVLIYRDASHLTGTYIRTLAPRLDAALHLDQP